jgi:hypothetical protein
VDQSKREVRAALAAGLIGRQARAAKPTVDQRLEALNHALLTGAEKAVAKATAAGDPSQVATAAKAVEAVRELLKASNQSSALAPVTVVVAEDTSVVDRAGHDADVEDAELGAEPAPALGV